MNRKRILIIDRDVRLSANLAQALQHLGEIKQLALAEGVLPQVLADAPDIVVLDTNTPTMADFDLCQQILESLPDTRIVFLAAEDSAENRDLAYSVGADDFIVKPAHLASIAFKIERLCSVITDASRLKQSLQEATNIAMMAISNSGEMGGVIDFMKRTSDCHDIEALLKALVSNCAGHFQLKVSAQIRTETEQKTLNSEGRSSPLEAELLLSLKEGERIYQYGSRMIINYPKVTLQIKDLNWENGDYIGRIRDHIAIMVEAADHRVDGIVLEQRMAAQSRKIRESLAAIADVVRQVEKDYKYQQTASHELFDNLRTQFSASLVGFGLTDAQENELAFMIEASALYADNLFEAGFSLDEKFSGVISVLNELVIEDTELASLRPSDLDDSVILF
ncbi:response regulator [Chitinibacter sp. FCG-7]|uniref:Response regulator n=1 Tax=Chitinibacter mangrovi TaxID=3153927 RepID=A0AAU7FD98_9NEIS